MNIKLMNDIESTLKANTQLHAALQKHGNKQNFHAILVAEILAETGLCEDMLELKKYFFDNSELFNTSQFNQSVQKFLDDGNASGFPLCASVVWRKVTDKGSAMMKALLN